MFVFMSVIVIGFNPYFYTRVTILIFTQGLQSLFLHLRLLLNVKLTLHTCLITFTVPVRSWLDEILAVKFEFTVS